MLSVTHASQHSQHQFDVTVVLLTDVIKLVIRIFQCCCCCSWLIIFIIVRYLRTTTCQLSLAIPLR